MPETIDKLVSDALSSAQIIAPGDEVPDHDFHCPLMSLPLAFGHNVENVPSFDRYIYACNDLCQKWQPLMIKLASQKLA